MKVDAYQVVQKHAGRSQQGVMGVDESGWCNARWQKHGKQAGPVRSGDGGNGFPANRGPLYISMQPTQKPTEAWHVPEHTDSGAACLRHWMKGIRI